ncbi:GGDEF domain-containing protein [Arhodomonas aquaeolei]|uniref:GGDEF domain-containing protein n=3 Tax=Ectothiorhodospiraceae TaxID=72276 RepID=UPI0021673F53|nr:GGDEF domain-containing protein [Arhodomonas aquaeolei]MCS4503078.1 GGDEF domain-containing protein [Arhodomonas aquaeolei]
MRALQTHRLLLMGLVGLVTALGVILAGSSLYVLDQAQKLETVTEKALFAGIRGELRGAYGALERRLEDRHDTFLALHRRAREWLRKHGRDADLGPLQETLSRAAGHRVDIYVISPDWHVTHTTYPPDRGLDFNQPALRDGQYYLERAHQQDDTLISPPTLEAVSRRFRVYSYSPLGDDGYSLELGFSDPAIDRFFNRLQGTAEGNDAYSARLYFLLWDHLLLSLREPWQSGTDPDGKARLLARGGEREQRMARIREVIASGKPAVTATEDGDRRYLIYVADIPYGESLTTHILAEVDLTADIAGAAQKRFTIALGLAGAAALVVILLAYLAARNALVRPLHHAVAAIERGRPIRLHGPGRHVHELQMLSTHYNALLGSTHARIRGLDRRASTDALTGLANRDAIEGELRAAVAGARAAGEQLAVIFLDIDHFKAINDAHGHLAGDHVLRRFSEVLQEAVRSGDHLGRWGGEEFIIVCPRTGLDGACTLAGHLREQLARTPIPEIGRCSASFGVAALGEEDDEHTLVARADQALYRAKADGRNCVRLE